MPLCGTYAQRQQVVCICQDGGNPSPPPPLTIAWHLRAPLCVLCVYDDDGVFCDVVFMCILDFDFVGYAKSTDGWFEDVGGGVYCAVNIANFDLRKIFFG